jgi:hypothetical protein
MRSGLALSLTLTLLSTTSCGPDAKPKPTPVVEPPPRIVVVTEGDPLCDVSRYPKPTGGAIEPRTVEADRVCMTGGTWRTCIENGTAWRARAEAYERCEERRAAAKAAREHLTSADAGVE